MASVNHTWSHCVNQMGKRHSRLLEERHGRGKACARHAMCVSAFRVHDMVQVHSATKKGSWNYCLFRGIQILISYVSENIQRLFRYSVKHKVNNNLRAPPKTGAKYEFPVFSPYNTNCISTILNSIYV